MNGDTIHAVALRSAVAIVTIAVVTAAVGVWTLRDDVREIKQDMQKIVTPLLRDHETRLRNLEDGRQATP